MACAPAFGIKEARANPPRRAPVLLVFVTGVYDTVEDVVRHGVLDVLRDAVGPVDAVVIQHETPSFFAGEFVQEFHTRVARNPRYRSYPHRVLLGFSSGGTAALQYVSQHPDEFDTLILYSPYLGPKLFIGEIEEAGGLAKWEPSAPIEDQELLWAWLRDYRVSDRGKPSVWLLWGAHDEAAPGLPILQAHLPADRILVAEGEHGWPAFNASWPEFVERHPEAFRPR
jgi:S-formylglutathione hydrolase FrmB